MTPDMEDLWQQGKLDSRCRDCGEGSAASNRCFKCGSKHLDYIPHGSPGWTACLGSGRGGSDTTAATAARRVLPSRSLAPA